MAEAGDVKQVLSEMKQKMTKAVDATKKEFQNLRTGRASVALVEGVMVDYYNTPTPLKSVANISTPDAKTIAITPWDITAINDIEKGVQKSGLGLNPINDGKVIRLQIPPLTSERRQELAKLVKKVAEEGRISVRSARHDGLEAVKKMEKDKLIPEDASRTTQKDIQKETDAFVALVDQALKNKEAEINEI